MHDLTAYTELDPLGSGGFAEVVRALHIVTKQIVALKKSRTGAEFLARTRREIELQLQLLHGNIMPVLDWADDGSWFVMPAARGDLGAIHELEPVEGAAILRLVEDVGAALAAAHRRGCVHRDLTPANILWLHDRWVVADWGFVKLPPGVPRTKLTRTGVGQECFTAPEVYRDGNAASPAGDIYSLGRVVGWLLGRGPLEPNKPTPVEPGSPWEGFVVATTRDDPAERPQSVDEALRLLEPAFRMLARQTACLPSALAGDIDVHRAAVDAFVVLLQDPTRRIQLDKLMDRETEATFARLTPEAFPVQAHEVGEKLEARLQRYGESCRLLVDLMIIGCAYGGESEAYLWTRAIRQIGHPSGEWGGSTAMLSLRYFPTTLLTYAGGLAAMAREKWWNFGAVTTAPRLARQADDREGSAVLRAAAAIVLDRDRARTLPGMADHHTPTSDWLFAFLRDPLRPLVRIEADYERLFDRYEYLVAMVVSMHREGGWVPPGRFAWRSARQRRHQQETVGDALRAEIEGLGANWGPVRGGVFREGSEAVAALERVEKAIGGSTWF